MTLQEQLEIIQAAIDGKEIEYYERAYSAWCVCNMSNTPIFNFQSTNYRIKPQSKILHQYLIRSTGKKSEHHYWISNGLYESHAHCQKENPDDLVITREWR